MVCSLHCCEKPFTWEKTWEKEQLVAVCLSTPSAGQPPLQGVQEGHAHHPTVTDIQQADDRKAIQQQRSQLCLIH